MADGLTEERETELIDMWQARPVLYEVVSKGYSNRNMRMVALTEIAEESHKPPVCHVRVCVALPTTCRSAFLAPFVAAVVVDDATQ